MARPNRWPSASLRRSASKAFTSESSARPATRSARGCDAPRERVGGGLEDEALGRARAERVAREGAGVREGVEHPAPSGERADRGVVVALIEVEARLLPARDRDGEAHAALVDDQLVGAGLALPAPLGGEPLDAGRRGVVEPVHRLAGESASRAAEIAEKERAIPRVRHCATLAGP